MLLLLLFIVLGCFCTSGCCYLFSVRLLLNLLLAVGCLLFCRLFVVCWPLFVHRLLLVVCLWVFVVICFLSFCVRCRLLFTVCFCFVVVVV